MSEIQQIRSLFSESTFLEGEARGWSLNMVGSMCLGIDQKGSRWTWRIIRPNGETTVSPGSFPSVQEAKNALRRELESRLERLADEETGPMSIS